MSSEKVDLSQIRGDWDFHSRYVTNAMEQTLKRLNGTWKELKQVSKKKGQVPVDGELMEEFMEACRQTRALCDDYLTLSETKSESGATRRKKSAKKTAKKSAKKTAKKTGRKTASKASKKSGGRK